MVSTVSILLVIPSSAAGPTRMEELRISDVRMYAIERKIENEPDGSIVLSMETMGRRDVIRWVPGYSAEAEGLEPEKVREEIAKSFDATGNGLAG